MSQKPLENCVEEIRDFKGNVVAIKFSATCMVSEGTWIPTPASWGLQAGIFKHSKGYSVRAHVHPRERYGKYIGCEMLYVVKGRLKVKLFDENGGALSSVVLNEGDCLVMSCGHSVEVLEDALVIEVKEGPYPGPERDKEWLEETP